MTSIFFKRDIAYSFARSYSPHIEPTTTGTGFLLKWSGAPSVTFTSVRDELLFFMDFARDNVISAARMREMTGGDYVWCS